MSHDVGCVSCSPYRARLKHVTCLHHKSILSLWEEGEGDCFCDFFSPGAARYPLTCVRPFFCISIHPDTQTTFAFAYKGQQHTWAHLPERTLDSPAALNGTRCQHSFHPKPVKYSNTLGLISFAMPEALPETVETSGPLWIPSITEKAPVGVTHGLLSGFCFWSSLTSSCASLHQALKRHPLLFVGLAKYYKHKLSASWQIDFMVKHLLSLQVTWMCCSRRTLPLVWYVKYALC